MSARVLCFPLRRVCSVLIVHEREDAGWLVLTPRGHGWLCNSFAEARREAKWLGHNLSLPVHEIAS